MNPSENQYVVLVDFDTNSPVNWTLKDVEIISIDEIHHNVIIPSEETMYESDIKELSKLFSVKVKIFSIQSVFFVKIFSWKLFYEKGGYAFIAFGVDVTSDKKFKI